MTKDAKEALKPCPFCACIPRIYPTNHKLEGDAWTRIKCETENCPASGGCATYYDSGHLELAIKAWNTRADQTNELKQAVKDLADAVASIKDLKDAMEIVGTWPKGLRIDNVTETLTKHQDLIKEIEG